MENLPEDIYAKWLDGSLTDVEKAQLTTSGDVEVLEKIIKEVDTWKTPDLRSDFEDLQQKVTLKSKKKSFTTNYKFAIAASLIFAVAFTYKIFNGNSTTFETAQGENEVVIFPDGTRALLNSNSSISFDEDSWEDNRLVELEGQAYFDVNKKGLFEVEIENGSIKVLGTKFDVLSHADYSLVNCFEGSVLASLNKFSSTVKANESFNSKGELNNILDTIPQWNSRYTKFQKSPIVNVIKSLSLQFGIDVNASAINTKRVFSGRFTNSNLEKALEMVFKPLNISYSILENEIVLHE